MAGPKPARPVPCVHQLDPARKPTNGWWPTICGTWVRQRFVTRHGWKVTCEVCNPPTRRKVRLKPRPAPAGSDLEMA